MRLLLRGERQEDPTVARQSVSQNLTEVDQSTPLPHLLDAYLNNDRWDDAGLSELLCYLRKVRDLQIPAEFQSLVAQMSVQ